MPRFRRLSEEVEAVQFDGVHDVPGIVRREEDQAPYVVNIHEQKCMVFAGDWILPEPDGIHHYPIAPQVFAQRYEPIGERRITHIPRRLAARASFGPERRRGLGDRRAVR